MPKAMPYKLRMKPFVFLSLTVIIIGLASAVRSPPDLGSDGGGSGTITSRFHEVGSSYMRLPSVGSMLSRAGVSEEVCEQTYGFLPCTITWLGNMFLILVYGFLMYTAATYLSNGSVFLPILGALPDAMLILGTGSSQEELPQPDIQQASCVVTPPSDIPVDIDSLCRRMDAIGVTSYMINHVKEYASVPDKIHKALRCAPNPAKLVLDVCHGIMAATSNYACIDFRCIYLLEQLSDISPSVEPQVQTEARTFADAIKAKLRSDFTSNYGFLLIVAVYNLSSFYRVNELFLQLNGLVSRTELFKPGLIVPLCHSLQLSEKIPDHVLSLIQEENLLLAVKYVCSFQLESEFMPLTLLKIHLKLALKGVQEKLMEGGPEAKVAAATLERSILQQTLEWILKLRLKYRISTSALQLRIEDLTSYISSNPAADFAY